MRTTLFALICLALVGCGEVKTVYNGYIDADLVYISGEFGGKVQELNATRGDSVKINQFLFKLEQTYESLGVKISADSKNELLSQKNELLSKIDYAKINLKRVTSMKSQDVASADELDQARLNLAVLQDELSSIGAKIKQSDLEIGQKVWKKEQKESFAPSDGLIFDSYFSKGEYAPSGQPLLALITKQNIKVIFFVSESDLGKIKINQKVKISMDGADESLSGKINYISNIAEYTPPIIFSRQERQKLVFKVEVKPNNIDLNQIHLGQPIDLELEP